LPDEVIISQAWAISRWTYRQLDRNTLDFLRHLPEQQVIHLEGTAPIRLVHGSPYNQIDPLHPERDFEKVERVAHELAESVLVCGHTHESWAVEVAEKLIFNPGSVGAPNNEDWRAQYALLTWNGAAWEVEHRRVDYDLDALRESFLSSGLWEQGGILARLALTNMETGHDVMGEFVRYAKRLAAQAGYLDAPVVPDSIWAVAEARWMMRLAA
jgi:diadenosine tetraphosphatase ApaH/serine/threonine PP2A family protein phosphatase